MPKKLLITIITFVVFHSSNVFAQKLKYKDVYPMLEIKNYELGIPTLQQFLGNSKNTNHANGNLQMGLYYESQTNQYDLIKDSTAMIGASDSAIIYLTKAKALITDKELKKNDDFYQEFYRRDLRTGDFGIKVSDVQLDIENKLKALRKINEYAKVIYSSLYKASNANAASSIMYKNIADVYGSANSFYLVAGDDQLDSLNTILDNGTTIKDAFDDVRNAVSRMNRKGYSPELNMNPINEFGQDGMDEVDFYTNDVTTWDYGNWADDAQRTIKREVMKMKDQLIRANQELKELNQKVNLGEQVSFEDIGKKLNEDLTVQLMKYDEDPLPIKLLNILIYKTQIDYITNSELNLKLADVEDVDYQLAIADSLTIILEALEIKVAGLVEPYITDGARKYPSFINGEYGRDIGLIKYRKGLERELSIAKLKWTNQYIDYLERSKWGVSEDGMDSLYLVPRTDSLYVAQNFSNYYSIATIRDDSANTYVVGLEFKGDVDQGFVSKIGGNRKIIWKNNFRLKSFTYSDSKLMVTGKFVTSGEGKIASYIYSFVPNSKNNLIVLSTTTSGEVKWVNELKSANEPVEVKFNDLVKETIVYLKTEEELENDTSDEPGYFVIDRGGKVR